MVSAFDFALAFALEWEVGGRPNGGYTNDPHDPGGETKWGISKRSYPELDIPSLTQAEAEAIYERDYWVGTGPTGQQGFCSVMPWPLNVVHFDCVVNVGNRKVARDGVVVMHRRANMILQRALGVDDDGYIGPITLAAIREQPPADVARRALQQRDLYYASLGSLYQRYGKGWHRRTNDLRRRLRLMPKTVTAGATEEGE